MDFTKLNQSTLSIFDGDRHEHAQLCADWTAEYHEKIQTKNSIETRWKDRPGKKNRSHLWDCLTMVSVALSEQGLSLESQKSTYRPAPAASSRFADMQKAAMSGNPSLGLDGFNFDYGYGY